MNKKSNPILSFLRGKGFYLALGLCILAAAGCSFAAIRSMMDQLNQNLTGESRTGDEQWNVQMPEQETPVENPAQSVPIMPQPTVQPASSGSSSSRQPVSEPSELSAGPQTPAALPQPACARPVSGPTLRNFSGDELVLNATLGDWRTHNGVDLQAEAGSEVVSALRGTVVLAAEDGNWGGVVEVESDGVTLRYAGLALPLKVAEGDALEAGQKLGRVGEAPCESADAPHLHLEAKKDGAWADPALWLE